MATGIERSCKSRGEHSSAGRAFKASQHLSLLVDVIELLRPGKLLGKPTSHVTFHKRENKNIFRDLSVPRSPLLP